MAEEGAQQTIDYEKLASILDGRQKATEESVLKGYFKEQGITGEEAAQAIKAFKDQRAANQPDIAGMEQSIAELQQQVEQANQRTIRAKIENSAIIEAAKMGIDPKATPYLTRMADLSDVVTDGTVDSSKVAAAISKVLEDLPALKPNAEQKGFRVGGEGGKAEGQTDESKLKAIFGVK